MGRAQRETDRHTGRQRDKEKDIETEKQRQRDLSKAYAN